MNSIFKSICVLIGLLLVLLAQHLSADVRATGEGANALSMPGQPLMAALTVAANRSILVNDAKTINGATILSGSTIETPDQVWAMVNTPSLGILNLAPNTKLTTAFDQDRHVKFRLERGCAAFQAVKEAAAEIETPRGLAAMTDNRNGGRLNVCFPENRSMPAESRTDVSRGLFGSLRDAVVGVIGGRTPPGAGVANSGRGNNPGPSTP